MIYRKFRTWRKALAYRSTMVLKGVYGLVFNCLIMGTVSLFAYVIRQANAFYRRETTAAVIIILISVGISVFFVGTFVKERHRRVQAEHRADSLAYDLSKFTQMYDTTDIIVINGDTVKNR